MSGFPGGREHSEWWIPAADLDELNAKIEVVAEYWPPGESGADA